MRPRDPRNEKRQVAKILANARRLFARHGFDRVSMDALAAACRVTKPTIYYYFKDKRAVLLAVLNAHWAEQATLLETFRPAASLRDTLRALAELVLSQTQRPNTGEIIRIVLAEAGRNRDISSAFFRVFGPAFRNVYDGPVRQHLHPRYSSSMAQALFHQYIGSLVHYSLMRQVLRASPASLPGKGPYVDLLVDSFVRGTAPSPSRTASVR